jgi:DNA invertase Pin-like site-specific DNA recombinase
LCDKKSGKDLERIEYKKMIENLREGDTVVIYKLDRISRSLRDLISIVNDFHTRKINFVSIHENIDTTSPQGKLTFHIFGAIAEFEREIIRQRTKSGLESARARGRVGGRPNKINDKDIFRLNTLYKEGKIEIRDLMNMFSISRPTLYRYLKTDCIK